MSLISTNASFIVGFIVFVSPRRDTASQYSEGCNISISCLSYSANHNALDSWPIRAHLASQNDELCIFGPFQNNVLLSNVIYDSFHLCFEDEQKSHCGFGMTWGWVINDNNFIFGWTNPLKPKNNAFQSFVCAFVRACVRVCVCVCVHVYVVYEDTNLYNDMGMT